MGLLTKVLSPYDLILGGMLNPSSLTHNSVPIHLNLLCHNEIYQGGESRDFLQLFCTCIRTVRVRKMVIIFLILNDFFAVKWKNLVFIRSDGMSMCFMLQAVLFYTSSSKDFNTLLQLMWKNKRVLENNPYIMTCCRNDQISALYHLKIH